MVRSSGPSSRGSSRPSWTSRAFSKISPPSYPFISFSSSSSFKIFFSFSPTFGFHYPATYLILPEGAVYLIPDLVAYDLIFDSFILYADRLKLLEVSLLGSVLIVHLSLVVC